MGTIPVFPNILKSWETKTLKSEKTKAPQIILLFAGQSN